MKVQAYLEMKDANVYAISLYTKNLGEFQTVYGSFNEAIDTLSDLLDEFLTQISIVGNSSHYVNLLVDNSNEGDTFRREIEEMLNDSQANSSTVRFRKGGSQ